MIGALICRSGLRRHDPERVATAAGFAYRCLRCGLKAPTALELLDPEGEDGHVPVERDDQTARLHGGGPAVPPDSERYYRGKKFA